MLTRLNPVATLVAVVALVVTGLVDICSECRTGRATWRHLSSSTTSSTGL